MDRDIAHILRPPLAALLARLYLGYVMLKEGLDKLRSGFVANHGVGKYVEQALAENKPWGWFRPFAQHQILGHAKLFGYLVVFGELFVGAFLLLGLFTRWAAVFGILLMLGYAAVAGSGLDPSPPVAFAFLFLVVLGTGAGRFLGLDGWLRDKAPRWMV